jgi:hypothetical protein
MQDHNPPLHKDSHSFLGGKMHPGCQFQKYGFICNRAMQCNRQTSHIIFWAEIEFPFTSEKWVSKLEQRCGYKKRSSLYTSCPTLVAEELTTFQVPLKYLKTLKYLRMATTNQHPPDEDWLCTAHTNRDQTMSKHACWRCAKNGWRPVVMKPNAVLMLIHGNRITK